MPDLARIKLPSPIRLAISSTSGKPALIVLSVLILAPLAAHAQGSPFDTGFNAIQSLFTGTIAKVASLVAIVIGGYGFAHGEPGAKGTGWRCRRNGHCGTCGECSELALGRIASFPDNPSTRAQTRELCQTKHSGSTAQIESSRACISRS